MARRPAGKQYRHLPAFLLLLLAEESEAYGGRLLELLRFLVPPQLPLDSGAVYRCLHDLEARGAVASQPAPGERGMPRRMYRITTAGRRELADWREDLRLRRDLLNRFLDRYAALPKGEV